MNRYFSSPFRTTDGRQLIAKVSIDDRDDRIRRIVLMPWDISPDEVEILFQTDLDSAKVRLGWQAPSATPAHALAYSQLIAAAAHIAANITVALSSGGVRCARDYSSVTLGSLDGPEGDWPLVTEPEQS